MACPLLEFSAHSRTSKSGPRWFLFWELPIFLAAMVRHSPVCNAGCRITPSKPWSRCRCWTAHLTLSGHTISGVTPPSSKSRRPSFHPRATCTVSVNRLTNFAKPYHHWRWAGSHRRRLNMPHAIQRRRQGCEAWLVVIIARAERSDVRMGSSCTKAIYICWRSAALQTNHLLFFTSTPALSFQGIF